MAGKKRRVGRPHNLPGHSRLGHVVEEHALFDEIYEMLRLHFSAETIVGLLEARHRSELQAGALAALPSVRSIERWRDEHMPPSELLPARLIEDKLRSIPVKVDLLKSLQQAYVIAENRIVRHAGTEEELSLPLPGLDKAIESLLKTGELLWRVGQDLGLYPRAMTADPAQIAAAQATAQTNIFVLDGQTKSVQMLTDGELDMAEAILKRDLES